jgi:hypothetical protein
MQEIVLRRLRLVLESQSLSQSSWLSAPELIEVMIGSPEYKAACDVHLDRQLLAAEVVSTIERYMKNREQTWLNETLQLHHYFSIDELEKHLKRTCGGAVPQFYSDAMTLIQAYYVNLEAKILHTLLSAEYSFDDHGLELLIPHVDSPFYNRQRMKQNYNARLLERKKSFGTGT